MGNTNWTWWGEKKTKRTDLKDEWEGIRSLRRVGRAENMFKIHGAKFSKNKKYFHGGGCLLTEHFLIHVFDLKACLELFQMWMLRIRTVFCCALFPGVITWRKPVCWFLRCSDQRQKSKCLSAHKKTEAVLWGRWHRVRVWAEVVVPVTPL